MSRSRKMLDILKEADSDAEEPELSSSFSNPGVYMMQEDVEVLTQQAALLARGGADAERAAVFLLRASHAGREERAAALRAGALSAVLPYLRPCTPTQLLVPLAQSFNNFCRYVEPEQPVELELVSPALPLIADLLDCKDQNVLEAACAIVANITYGESERADAARAVPGLVARLEALLAHDALSVKQVALTALGNLLASGRVQAEGCVGLVAVFLRDGPPALAQGAARAAGNMLADPATIQRALNAGVLPLLCKLLVEGSEGKEEAARALANLCRFGSDEQRALVFDMDVLEPCCAALAAAAGAPPTLQLLAGLNELMEKATYEDASECYASSMNSITNSAKVLSSRLHELGILDVLERLLPHDNKEVQSQALELKADVAFYMRGDNIVYGDGKVLTVADIADELQSPEAGRRLRAASAAYRMMCRARCDQNDAQAVTLQRAPKFDRIVEVRDLMESHAVLERVTADLNTDDCPDLQCQVAKVILSVYTNEGLYDTAEQLVHSEPALNKLLDLAGKEASVATAAIHALKDMPYIFLYENSIKTNTRIVQTLLPFLRRDTPRDLLTSCLVIYYNLSFNDRIVDVLASALPRILDLLTIENRKFAWAILDNIIDCSDEGREAVLAVPGLTARVVGLMAHKVEYVRTRALNTVTHLLDGSPTQRERCLDEGCLEHIARFLRSEINDDLVMKAAQAAELVLSGPRAHVCRAVDAGFLIPLLDIMLSTENCDFDLPEDFLEAFPEAKLSAAKATSNLCQNGSAAHRDLFVELGGLEAWAGLFQEEANLISYVLSGLDALDQAAREGDVNIEALRSRMKALDYRKLLTELRSRDDIDWSAMNDDEQDLLKQYSALL